MDPGAAAVGATSRVLPSAALVPYPVVCLVRFGRRTEARGPLLAVLAAPSSATGSCATGVLTPHGGRNCFVMALQSNVK